MLNTLQQPRQAKTTEPSRLPNMISYSIYSWPKETIQETIISKDSYYHFYLDKQGMHCKHFLCD